MNRQPDRTEDALHAALGVMIEDTPPAPEWEDLFPAVPMHSLPATTPRRGWTIALATTGIILVLVGAVAMTVLVLGSNEDVIEPSPTSLPLQPLSGGWWEAVETRDPYQLNFFDFSEPGHAVYDSESDRILSFRGFNNPTWAFDTNRSEWAEVMTSQYPVTIQEMGTPVYDPIGDRVVVFNDRGSTVAFNTEWGDWSDLAPVSGPDRRRGHGAVFDSQSGAMVMFGGGVPDFTMLWFEEVLDETWTFDTAENLWSEVSSAVLPPPRVWPSMAYDSQSDRVVMFGGATGPGWQVDPERVPTQATEFRRTDDHVLGDTWVFDTETSTWTEMFPPVSPAPRTWAAMWYDPEADLVFLYGGASKIDRWPLPTSAMLGGEELWAYDLDGNEWMLFQVDAPNPGYLVGAAATFDLESEAAVVFGGGRYDQETKKKGFNVQTWIYRHAE